MQMDIVTKEDLEQFKKELFEDIRKLFADEKPVSKKWLKSYEVRDVLRISRGTLQQLRINGTLKATKIGGLMFYAYDDIVKLMKGKK